MSGNEIEARLAILIASTNEAQRQIAHLFAEFGPHFMSEAESVTWRTALILAREVYLRRAADECTALLESPLLSPRSQNGEPEPTREADV